MRTSWKPIALFPGRSKTPASIYSRSTIWRSLGLAAESAVRDVIAKNPIQSALAEGRQQIADQITDVLQTRLDSFQAGILITQVQLLRVDPPLAVIDAFNDVQRARADQKRARNEVPIETIFCRAPAAKPTGSSRRPRAPSLRDPPHLSIARMTSKSQRRSHTSGCQATLRR